jgi:hypothetical protein
MRCIKLLREELWFGILNRIHADIKKRMEPFPCMFITKVLNLVAVNWILKKMHLMIQHMFALKY